MSLDPLFLTAAAPVGVAAALVLGTCGRLGDGGRAFRAASRLLTGSLVLALFLAVVATFRWAEATIGATGLFHSAVDVPSRPPLVAFAALAIAAGLVRAFALRRRSELRSRSDLRARTELESGPGVGLVGDHGVSVPRPRMPVGGGLLAEAVPAGGGRRPDAEPCGEVRPAG